MFSKRMPPRLVLIWMVSPLMMPRSWNLARAPGAVMSARRSTRCSWSTVVVVSSVMLIFPCRLEVLGAQANLGVLAILLGNFNIADIALSRPRPVLVFPALPEGPQRGTVHTFAHRQVSILQLHQRCAIRLLFLDIEQGKAGHLAAQKLARGNSAESALHVITVLGGGDHQLAPAHVGGGLEVDEISAGCRRTIRSPLQPDAGFRIAPEIAVFDLSGKHRDQGMSAERQRHAGEVFDVLLRQDRAALLLHLGHPVLTDRAIAVPGKYLHRVWVVHLLRSHDEQRFEAALGADEMVKRAADDEVLLVLGLDALGIIRRCSPVMSRTPIEDCSKPGRRDRWDPVEKFGR